MEQHELIIGIVFAIALVSLALSVINAIDLRKREDKRQEIFLDTITKLFNDFADRIQYPTIGLPGIDDLKTNRDEQGAGIEHKRGKSFEELLKEQSILKEDDEDIILDLKNINDEEFNRNLKETLSTMPPEMANYNKKILTDERENNKV